MMPFSSLLATLGITFLILLSEHHHNGALMVNAAAAAFSAKGSRVFVSTPVSNFPKRTVQDCMFPAKHVLTPDMSVDDAMQMLLTHGLSGAPVVNNLNEKIVVGIVTSFDFLQQEAFEGSLLPMEGSIDTIERYVEAAKKICGQRVEDVMTKDPTTISANLPMRDAATLMTKIRIHRLPVVNDDGNNTLVGVLTSASVMKDLLHIVNSLPPATDEEDDE